MFIFNIFFLHASPAQSFRSAAQPSHRKGRDLYEVTAQQRERVSIIEPQNSWRKRALNTTAAFNQRRPASAAARALNDGHEGKANLFTPWYVCFLFLLKM